MRQVARQAVALSGRRLRIDSPLSSMRWRCGRGGRGWRGEGRLADEFVPVVDRELAGDQGGGATVAVVDDLQQIASRVGVHWCQAPIVENQQLDPAEGCHELG